MSRRVAALPQRNGGAAYGTCPTCRTRQRLIVTTGKVGVHGRTAAAPRGCAGVGERPLPRSAAAAAAAEAPLPATIDGRAVVPLQRTAPPDVPITLRVPPAAS